MNNSQNSYQRNTTTKSIYEKTPVQREQGDSTNKQWDNIIKREWWKWY